MKSGAVYGPPFSKEGLKETDLKLSPFITHFHAPVQHDPAIVVQMNEQITHLRPADHKGGKVHALPGQGAAQLSGGQSFRALGAANSTGRKCSHG